MTNTENTGSSKEGLRAYMTPLGAWAFAFGSAVGWGSFMMPGTTFLPSAGPVGTLLGFIIGSIVMFIIGANYHFLVRRFPDEGGLYSYMKNIFNLDHAFMGSWFLILTYAAIIWANSTALALISRYLFNGSLQAGFHYKIAGFDVYMSEVCMAIFALALMAWACLRPRLAMWLQIVFCFLMCIGLAITASYVFKTHTVDMDSLQPYFSPSNTPFFGIFNIVAMAPWAFVGFEAISNSAKEFKFSNKKFLPIVTVALVVSAVMYCTLMMFASVARPEEYATWQEYISVLGQLSGEKGMPVFYAINTSVGKHGVVLLGVMVLAAVLTGILGNYVVVSRLLYAMAKDGLMPRSFGKVNKDGVPANAIVAVMCVSILVPFLGRTATGWVVDVTTIGAATAYAYVSASALKQSRRENNKRYMFTGGVGLIISMIFILAYLLPNVLAVSALSREAYLILAAWSILGLAYFRYEFAKNTSNGLGRSTVVLVAMLFLVFFTSIVWMRQSSQLVTENVAVNLQQHYAKELENDGVVRTQEEFEQTAQYIKDETDNADRALKFNSIVQLTIVMTAMAIMFNVYSHIHKREKKIEIEKTLAEEVSRAKTSFLSNMSHEIRTPMNAIIGLDNIALQNKNLEPKTREQLEKIGSSARHLLGLINDILDMSRIESGRMVLKEEEFSFKEFLEPINVMINGQCQDKGLEYVCNVIGEVDPFFVGDVLKLRQVLINILGNAVKFTEEGTVTLTVEQTAEHDNHKSLRFVVKDTGIGMDKEYLPKIFEAFSQEDATSTNRYGGSGLGMAITKNIVEMLHGDISVDSEKGVGTTFTINVALTASERMNAGKDGAEADAGRAAGSAGDAGSMKGAKAGSSLSAGGDASGSDSGKSGSAGTASGGLEQQSDTDGSSAFDSSSVLLEGRHVLIAEDMELNAEILIDLLDLEGITAERAVDGQMAVEMFEKSPEHSYDAILMDIRMPVMDGLSATRAIRASEHPDAKTIPIIAMTANAFEEDMQHSLQAGMNAHLSKPVEPDRLYETLRMLIGNREAALAKSD